jgi:diguanylate cyclase (GGDEF)-like protein
MTNMNKKTIHKSTLGYNIALGIDYQILSKYMLKIHQHKDMASVFLEISKCLKDILKYEALGVITKKGSQLDIWTDSNRYSRSLISHITGEFECQNNDLIVHFFDGDSHSKCHNIDDIDTNKLISYNVIDGNITSRLYVIPGKKMLPYHDNIINTMLSSIQIAIESSQNIRQLEKAAIIDPLSNCYNRTALSTFMENDIAYAMRHKSDLSVIMINLDSMKNINAIHGHTAGNAVIREIANLIGSAVRKYDYLARYEDDTFVLVLPDNALWNAMRIAEKLRTLIKEHSVVSGEATLRTTASFGVASLEKHTDSKSLLQEAGERLSQAKTFGKNCVVPGLLPGFAGDAAGANLFEHTLAAVSAA